MDTVADIEVRRSARRRRTVSAYREGSRIVVLIPARFSRREEADWVGRMVRDVEAREDRARRRGPGASDEALLLRAIELNRRYLDGLAVPASIRWVDTMASRWASCTTVDRTIRMSARLQDFPPWVVDYVILHELSHLLVPGHGPEFWALASRYERTERARGFLDGYSIASRTGVDDDSW
jgi:predicted metal-dependent hydrolase